MISPTVRSAISHHPVVWACVAAAVFAFFLPWARLDFDMGETEKQISRSAKRALSKSFGKTKKAPKRQAKGTPLLLTKVRGYQIPIVANRKNAKVAMQLVRMFTKKDDQIGLKSWLVYLMPGLAVLAGWLLSGSRSRAPVLVAVLVLCAGIAGFGFWTLFTTDTRKEFAVVIGSGIWLSLAAYVGLAVLAGQALASRKTVC